MASLKKVMSKKNKKIKATPLEPERKLGILEGKGAMKISKNWKMTDEEFLNS
jgi:hypothetical protein